MGTEIRSVIPNWEHPKKDGAYIPLFDESYSAVLSRWKKEKTEWEDLQATLVSGADAEASFEDLVESRPEPESYRPDWKPEEMTWVQLYENTTEGTPVTPAFPTRAALVDHMVEHGDSYAGTWSREQAFIKVYTPGNAAVTEEQYVVLQLDSRSRLYYGRRQAGDVKLGDYATGPEDPSTVKFESMEIFQTYLSDNRAEMTILLDRYPNAQLMEIKKECVETPRPLLAGFLPPPVSPAKGIEVPHIPVHAGVAKATGEASRVQGK